MLQRQDPRWAYVLVNLATLLWASNIVLGRLLRDQIGPSSLGAGRFIIAGTLFLIILQFSNRGHRLKAVENLISDRQRRALWVWYLGMGFCGVFAFTSLLYLALRYTTASHAALINAASPLITAVLAASFLKERFTPSLIAGSSLSLLGVAVIIGITPNPDPDMPFTLWGDLLCLLAAALWGVYSILSRMATRLSSSLQATAYSIWLALPLLIIGGWIEWQTQPPQLTPTILSAAVYIGIFPSVVAYLAWNEGVQRAGPNQAMAFFNMLPVYGTLLGVVFLGESLEWTTLLGGALVVAGGLVVAKFR